jgi:hypothetical protein
MTSHDFGQGTFAGAIWAHNRVNFATWNGQTKTANDLLIANINVEVVYPKFVHKAGGLQVYGDPSGLRIGFLGNDISPKRHIGTLLEL